MKVATKKQESRKKEAKKKAAPETCPECGNPLDECTCEAEEETEAEGAKADEGEEERLASEAAKADEEEGEEETEGAKADEEEGEGEDEAEAETVSPRTKVLLALRSKLDEAHDPETVQDLLAAIQAYLDEELAEISEESEGEAEGETATEDEGEGEEETAGEGEGEEETEMEDEGGEDEGEDEDEEETEAEGEVPPQFKKFQKKAKADEAEAGQFCAECGAPVGKKGKFMGASESEVYGLRHRLQEKEVRFVQSNDRNRVLEARCIALVKENAELRSKLLPLSKREAQAKKLAEAEKFIKTKKLEGLVDPKNLMPFEPEQWESLVEISAAGLVEVETGEGERTIQAAALLNQKRESKDKDDKPEAAVTTFMESRRASGGGGYEGSSDAEDAFADVEKK